MKISRRSVLRLLAAAATTSALPARAQSREVFVVTYPGSIDESFKRVIGPQVRQRFGATPTFTPMLNTDLLGRLQAARANPPFDLTLWDSGSIIVAKQNDLLEKFTGEGSANYADIPSALIDPDGFGPAFALSMVGIAYNPKKVAAPPTSWLDLWRPEYKGRVGIVGPASTLGTTFLAEVAKLHGGSEMNVEPGFVALRELAGSLGAIPPTPGALSTAMGQGQVDIGPNFFYNVAAQKARGADIAFAVPKSGLPLQATTLSIVKNARNADVARRLIDLLLDPAIQTQLEAAPWSMIPAHPKVPLTGMNREIAASVTDLLKIGTFLDWSKVTAERPRWIERFNQEIRM